MVSVRKEIAIDGDADHAWAALRDFGAVHRRVAPGFVVDVTLDGDARIVTFANGSVARELLVECDDARRRLVYAIVGGRITTHSASVQVLEEGAGRCRVVWVADLLPNELGDYFNAQMDTAAAIMQRTLGRAPAMQVLAEG